MLGVGRRGGDEVDFTQFDKEKAYRGRGVTGTQDSPGYGFVIRRGVIKLAVL